MHDIFRELRPIPAQVRDVSRMFPRVDISGTASRHANLPISKTLGPRGSHVNFRSRIRDEPKLLQLVRSSVNFVLRWPPSLFQQISNPVFHLVIITFARMFPPNCSLRIDQGLPWPILVSVEFPRSVLAIDCDRVSDSKPLHCTRDIIRKFLELELRSMDPDQDERVSCVFFVEQFHVRQGSNAIYTTVSPEVEEDHLSSQAGHRQWGGVDPSP